MKSGKEERNRDRNKERKECRTCELSILCALLGGADSTSDL
jgi:hypothetical protein